jgi:hypothetical protein
VPLSQRLDELVGTVESAGQRAFRKDVVAALIFAAPEDPDELAGLLVRYRKATAGDAALRGRDAATVLSLARPKPGRRSR